MAGVEILYSITKYDTNIWTLALGISLVVSAIIVAGFIIYFIIDFNDPSALFCLCVPILICCLGVSLIQISKGKPYEEYVVHVDSEVAFAEFYDKYEITDRLNDYVYQVKEREEN